LRHGDGRELTFETLEPGGEYPDTMPQVIRLTDAEGRSVTYEPITVRGKVADSLGFRVVRKARARSIRRRRRQ
jgi:hypothetical protein